MLPYVMILTRKSIFEKIHIRNLTANFIIMGRPAGDASFSRDVRTLLKAQCYFVQNAFLSFVSGGKRKPDRI